MVASNSNYMVFQKQLAASLRIRIEIHDIAGTQQHTDPRVLLQPLKACLKPFRVAVQVAKHSNAD